MNQGAKPLHTTRACRQCGCTDLMACLGGCHWVETDLCSKCAQTPPSLDRLKRRAKSIKKAEGIQHARALDKAAQAFGFSNYVHARRQLPAPMRGGR